MTLSTAPFEFKILHNTAGTELMRCLASRLYEIESCAGQFSNPQGMAIDAQGNIYVADTWNDRIQKFDSSGGFITKWGSPGSDDGKFISPLGVAIDSSGKVYVADNGNNRIQKFGDTTTTPPDATAPIVTNTIPNTNATGVAPTTDVTASFSEDMLVSSINANTFKLFKKGSTTKIAAAVSYAASTDTASLDPNQDLTRRATYKAVVTTGAKDRAGHPLQQQHRWYFTVG